MDTEHAKQKICEIILLCKEQILPLNPTALESNHLCFSDLEGCNLEKCQSALT